MTGQLTGSGSGLTFVGVFDVQRFTAAESGVTASGTLTGAVTNAAGDVVSVVREISMPALVGISKDEDEVLLEVGPLSLNLLCLQVDLDCVVIHVDSKAGPPKLLSSLHSAVTSVPNNPTHLAELLNQFLATSENGPAVKV